jgi:ribosomal protein L11
LTKRAAARRGSIKVGIAALAVVAGMVAGAAPVYTALGDQLLTFLGFTEPKDCG